MQTNQPEAIELHIATLRAAVNAFNPVAVGDRVTWIDCDAVQHYGTVHVLGQASDGQPMAGLRVAGVSYLWCEPVDNLAKVCGVCVDCRTLSQRPFCMASAGSTYWRAYRLPRALS